jgi:hypothetical protein
MSKCENCLSKNVCRWYENGAGKNLCCADDFPCPEQKDKDHFIKVPCKVGDRVYSINIGDKKTLKIWIEPNGDRITQIKINRDGYHFKCWWGYFHLSDIGKTVFLTKEEAEKALKERSKDNGKM